MYMIPCNFIQIRSSVTLNQKVHEHEIEHSEILLQQKISYSIRVIPNEVKNLKLRRPPQARHSE